MLLITYSISKQKSLLFSKTNTYTFKTFYKLENIFKRSNIFVYILTNKNHYRDCLNNGLFTKYFQKTIQSIISNKKKVI